MFIVELHQFKQHRKHLLLMINQYNYKD